MLPEGGREGSLRQPLDLLHPRSRCTAEQMEPLHPSFASGAVQNSTNLSGFFSPPLSRLLNPLERGSFSEF